MSVSGKIARFIIDTSFEAIPDDVIDQSKFALADYLSVTYVGAKTDIADQVLKYVSTSELSGDCHIIGRLERSGVAGAILANGMISHILDFDDVGLTALNHPSATNAPVSLVLGQALGKSGKEVLRAFTLAVEGQHKLAAVLMPELTNRGWHTTSVIGTIGATVAASVLLGLDEQKIINALGIGASLATGIRANFGTMTKAYHAGLAAGNGYKAARMAMCGFTSSEFAFEGHDGFALAFAGKKISEESIDLGEPWDAQYAGFQFKKYPVCSSSHTAIDAFLELKKQHGFGWEEIEHVTSGVSEFAFRNLVFQNPQNALEAKFSMPYAIACSGVFGELTLENFCDDFLIDEKVRELMGKVDMVLDDAYKDQGILENEPAIVYVDLVDGRKYSCQVDYALGTIRNPLNKNQLFRKFSDCIHDRSPEDHNDLFETVFALDKVENVRELIGRFALN